jgi:hypothetical protein
LLSAAIAAVALALITYILWPTWQDHAPGGDPGRLPITVGGTLFNIPPQAIRFKVQRHAGAQERIDMALVYPSLTAPEPAARVTAAPADDNPMAIDRLFITVVAHGGALGPAERLQTIFPRYLDASTTQERGGISTTAFHDASPYRGEDLLRAESPALIARCTRDAATPGMCLSERRLAGADMTFRFPRAWLSDWRALAANLEKAQMLIHATGPR